MEIKKLPKEEAKIKFVFFGTGDFAANILKVLFEKGLRPCLIITMPDKPKGRGKIVQPPPVKVWAQKYNIPCQQPTNLISNSKFLISNYDLFVVAEYGKIIPKEVLKLPRYGALNVHPSLLPKFRGPSPIQSFILSGEKETGISIILMDEEMDHGPILASKKIRADNDEVLQYKNLEKQLAEIAGSLLAETIPQWIEGKIKPKEQNHNQATYCYKIKKEDGLVDLNNNPPEQVHRKVLAFTPWPGAYFFLSGKRIIITKSELRNGKLIINRVKPEGKREMSLKDFIRGVKDSKTRYFLSEYL